MNKKHEVHPVASLFPMMDDVSFQALKEDIKTHGQLEPILYWKKMLVDGRNRLRACEELNIEPREVELMDETDPIAYVISHNLHRRHLTTSQRSDVAAKIATMRSGTRTDLGSKDTKSIDDAAKQMKVSPASVKRAKKVHSKGSKAVKKAMADGTLPVSTAAALVDAVPDKEQQTKLMEDGVDTVRDAIKTIAKDDKIVFHDVDDDDDAPLFAPSLPVKQQPASKPKKSGCKNCERLSEELKQVRERLNRAMKTCSEQVTVMSDQATLISDLVDSKEQVSTVAKPSKQKPAGWLSAQEVVVSH
jgi:ParB-like chromosome segregation protein Spo0J